jgi:hypothetical protein
MNTALPYTWKQELGELDLVVPVPKGTRAKDLSIVIAKKKLGVGLKGKDKILDGELCQEVKLDDSTWTLRGCFLKIKIFLTQLVCYRGPRSCSYSSRKAEPAAVVGECPHSSSQNRCPQDPTRE